MQNKRLGKKKPKPKRILFRFFFFNQAYLSIVFIPNYCVFFNLSCRFATDSYIQINAVLGIYKNNCYGVKDLAVKAP